MDRLMEIKRGRGADDPTWAGPSESRGAATARPQAGWRGATAGAPDPGARRSRPTTRCSRRPFVGSRVAKGISLDDIAAYINETALFRTSGVTGPRRRPTGMTRATTSSRTDPGRAARAAGQARRGTAGAQVAYGYFPVNSEGNDLVVWKDDTRSSEWLRFTLPPPDKDRGCASPTSSGRRLGRATTTPPSTW